MPICIREAFLKNQPKTLIFQTIVKLINIYVDYLALQVNDTKDEDRVIYIDSIDSLYTNITGYGNRNYRKRK